MKNFLKNFIVSCIAILTISTFISSCSSLNPIASNKNGVSIVSQKLGDSGISLNAGVNTTSTPKRVWIALVGDLNQMKKKSVERLGKWFPGLKSQLDLIK